MFFSGLRRAAVSLALSALVLSLAYCRRTEEASNAPRSATPQRGGTVAIAWGTDIAGVNELIVPSTNATNDVLFQLFDHLVEEQPDFTEHAPTMAPQLARTWEWSEDRKTLTFHLDEKAVWSDGVPVTAEDVRFSWQAQSSPEVAYSDANSKRFITDVEAVDPHTARFHFSRAYAKQLLDANEGVILPKHTWSALPFGEWRKGGDWFRDHLVTSGPFRLASWKPQQEIVLTRNERYFQAGRPRLDRAVLRIVPEASSQVAQLLAKEVDFATNMQPTDAPRIQADPRLELRAIPFRNFVYAAWNNQREPFNDPDIRRALTLAIDRQKMVDTLWGPYAKVAVSPILSFVWAHDKSIEALPYDPTEARKILAAKGFRDADGDGVVERNGKPFRLDLTTNAGNQQRIDATVMIQAQLKNVGIAAAPGIVEFNALMAKLDEGNYDCVVLGVGMDTSLDLTTFLHSRSIGVDNGNNLARYSNPAVDRLIEEAAGQRDIEATVPLVRRIEKIWQADQPATLLWESKRLMGMNRRLRDAQPSPIYMLWNLRDWWVEPEPAAAP
ncbi:MAG TPA: ABC transporter substrate-binding protein [Thermoanaerobaculia bacterium]|nr:ABC transporter substrate-binding protein [Thermoanaerobaculia bacterium]